MFSYIKNSDIRMYLIIDGMNNYLMFSRLVVAKTIGCLTSIET